MKQLRENVNGYQSKYSFKTALHKVPDELIEYKGSVSEAPNISDTAKEHYKRYGYKYLIILKPH